METLLAWVVCVMLAISISNGKRAEQITAPIPPPPTVEQMAQAEQTTKTAKVEVNIKQTETGEEINIKVNK